MSFKDKYFALMLLLVFRRHQSKYFVHISLYICFILWGGSPKHSSHLLLPLCLILEPIVAHLSKTFAHLCAFLTTDSLELLIQVPTIYKFKCTCRSRKYFYAQPLNKVARNSCSQNCLRKPQRLFISPQSSCSFASWGPDDTSETPTYLLDPPALGPKKPKKQWHQPDQTSLHTPTRSKNNKHHLMSLQRSDPTGRPVHSPVFCTHARLENPVLILFQTWHDTCYNRSGVCFKR